MKKVFISVFLIALGTFKPVADLMGFAEISGLGAALNMSPSMKVFTAHNGYETFSAKFDLELHWQNQSKESININHSLYKNIKGPYNRRNVYGALISYGPLLSSNPHTKDMFLNVAENVFCKTDSFLEELGIEVKANQLQKVVIKIHTSPSMQGHRLAKDLEINCG